MQMYPVAVSFKQGHVLISNRMPITMIKNVDLRWYPWTINSSPPLDKMTAFLADDNFKCIFVNENDKIPIPRSPLGNTPALVQVQYIPRNMHTVFALLCFVVVIHWLIFPYPSCLLHWHCGILTIAPVPAKQPWWIWKNTSCEFIMNDCITTTKQSTTKPCAYFLWYTVSSAPSHYLN